MSGALAPSRQAAKAKRERRLSPIWAINAPASSGPEILSAAEWKALKDICAARSQKSGRPEKSEK